MHNAHINKYIIFIVSKVTKVNPDFCIGVFKIMLCCYLKIAKTMLTLNNIDVIIAISLLHL